MNPLQKYNDVTYTEALAQGCDIVQLKYIGTFKRFDAGGSGQDVFLGDVFAGPRWEGSKIYDKMIVWDCLRFKGRDMQPLTYRERWAALSALCVEYGPAFLPVTNTPIIGASNLWSVLGNGPHVRGLVYRDSKAPFTDVLGVARWYPEVPKGLP